MHNLHIPYESGIVYIVSLCLIQYVPLVTSVIVTGVLLSLFSAICQISKIMQPVRGRANHVTVPMATKLFCITLGRELHRPHTGSC